MDIFDCEFQCYQYFKDRNIRNRSELRKEYKTCPINGVSQSFAESLFQQFKNNFLNKEKNHSKNSQTVCISDLHIPNQDDTTLNLVFDCIVNLQPENLVLLGDILDCYWNSSFLKNPKNNIYLQEEADIFYKKFSYLRKYIPHTNIYYILGNHEDRLLKDQWEKPQYIGLRALEPRELLRLDKLNIDNYRNKVIINDFIYYHGDKVSNKSSYTAKAEFEGFQMNSGISGHTHRLGSYYHTYDKCTKNWFENGCLCDLDPEYIREKVNWQQGFSVVNYFEGINQVDQILIQDHKFKYEGKVYC